MVNDPPLEERTTEPVLMGRISPLKRAPDGRPLLMEMPRRAEVMERASDDLFKALGRLTVGELKALRPTGPYVDLIEALMVVRQVMGGEGSDR